MPAEKLQSMYPRFPDGYAMPCPKPDRMNVENSDFAVPAGRERFHQKSRLSTGADYLHFERAFSCKMKPLRRSRSIPTG
jgi:hypothetical protein